jgi:deoxyribodipyrimidine photolyase
MSDEKKSISMNELKSVQPRSLKSRLLSLGFTIVIGVGGFYGGIYYGIMKTDVYMENLMTEYEKISDEVEAFKKVSDPETIRKYVKELNKILDDVKFLNKVIETGQLADESLSEFFKESQSQLDEVNERLLVLSHELREVHMELYREVAELKDSTQALINDKVTKSEEEVKKQLGEMYDKLDVLYKELEEVSILVDKAKETFFGKAIFKENE